MAERRHRFRAPSGRSVYWFPSARPEERQEAVLMDISSGGARLRSVRAPIHHHVTLVVRADDRLPVLVLPSTLVRIERQLESGEFAWALAFVSPDAATQVRLTRLVFSEAKRRLAEEQAAPPLEQRL